MGLKSQNKPILKQSVIKHWNYYYLVKTGNVLSDFIVNQDQAEYINSISGRSIPLFSVSKGKKMKSIFYHN